VADEATAFAPGHITGFFEIRDEATDPAQIGSRGAGFSVSLGVTSRVRLDRESPPGITVTERGAPLEAATTRRALALLVADEPVHVHVEQRMDLPVSQGFGMSAGGALSAALALVQLLGRSRQEAVWAAHCAEVFQRTGLGDVVGAAAGGFEVRVRPGCAPYGEIRPWAPDGPATDVLLAVVSPAVLTKRVLTDPARRADIQRRGGALVDEFLEDPTLSQFVDASRRFATESRLATAEILKLWDQVGHRVALGQCQLGGSVFVFGADADVERRLRALGPVFRTRIDREGARPVEPGAAAAGSHGEATRP
jgi:pantoate kinase